MNQVIVYQATKSIPVGTTTFSAAFSRAVGDLVSTSTWSISALGAAAGDVLTVRPVLTGGRATHEPIEIENQTNHIAIDGVMDWQIVNSSTATIDVTITAREDSRMPSGKMQNL